MVEFLTQFGPAGATVAIVWIFIKYLIPVIDKLAQSIDKNTAVTADTHEFLKTLNGDLKAVVAKKKGEADGIRTENLRTNSGD